MKRKILSAAAVIMAMSMNASVYAAASPWGGGQDVKKPNSVIDAGENAVTAAPAEVSHDEPVVTAATAADSGNISENRLVQGSEPVRIINFPAVTVTETEKPADDVWFDSDNIVTGTPGRKSHTDIVDSSKQIYSYKDMSEDIRELEKAYGDLMDVHEIGTTADRRKIYDIVTGDIGADKQMIVQASCHGREYMTSLLVMEQLEYALNNYDSVVYGGRTARECFEGVEVHIIPMLNPDGVSISQYGKNGLQNPVLRLNLSSIYSNNVNWRYTKLRESEYYRRWKANGRGVDINRNFDGRWKYVDPLRGTSGQGYKGREAESESETRALCDLTRSLSNPVSAVSYHATGSVIWWDYGQNGDFRERCARQAAAVHSVTGYPYNPADPTSAGGYCDWIIEKGGERTVPTLIEIGSSRCPLPLSEYPAIWRENRSVLFAVAVLY